MPKSNSPKKSIQVQQSYTEIRGPIPPPQVLEQYNNVVSNAAERIISMAEKQSDHRIALEKSVVNSNIIKSYWGMFLAAFIACFGLYIAKEISINGNPWAAGIIAALDLGGLISVAFYNASYQKKELKSKQLNSSATPHIKK